MWEAEETDELVDEQEDERGVEAEISDEDEAEARKRVRHGMEVEGAFERLLDDELAVLVTLWFEGIGYFDINGQFREIHWSIDRLIQQGHIRQQDLISVLNIKTPLVLRTPDQR